MSNDEIGYDALKTEGGVVYHYTDQRGLLGILESNCIWATHVGYLNDASEFQRGLAIAKRFLEGFEYNPKSTKDVQTAKTPAQRDLEEVMAERFRAGLRIVDEVDVFISSFFDTGISSKAVDGGDPGDVLNQWRSYSPGNSGFSIGFDKALLTKHISEMKSGSYVIRCGPCNYDSYLQEKCVNDSVAQFASSLLERLYSFIYDFARKYRLAWIHNLRDDEDQPIEDRLDKLEGIITSQMNEFCEPFGPMWQEFFHLGNLCIGGGCFDR